MVTDADDDGLLGRVVAGLGAHPLRVTGAIGAALAGWITWLMLEAGARGMVATARAGDTVSMATVADFVLAHPAYPVAIVVGLALLAFGD